MDYIDTGLFLDHRLTREMVGKSARFRRGRAGRTHAEPVPVTPAVSRYAASAGLHDSCRPVEHVPIGPSGTSGSTPWRRPPIPSGRTLSRFLSRNPGGPVRTGGGGGPADLLEQQVDRGGLAPLAPRDGSGRSGLDNFRRFKLNTDAVTRAGYSFRDHRPTILPEYRNSRRIHACWRLVRAD